MKAVVRRWSKEVGPSCRWTRVRDAIASRKTQNLLFLRRRRTPRTRVHRQEGPSRAPVVDGPGLLSVLGSYLALALIWHELLSGLGSYPAFERVLRRRRTRVRRRRKTQILFASIVIHRFNTRGSSSDAKTFCVGGETNQSWTAPPVDGPGSEGSSDDAKTKYFAFHQRFCVLRDAIASRTRVHRQEGHH